MEAPPTSGVNQLQPADLIGRLGEGGMSVTEQGEADGQDTVAYGLWVGSGAGVEEEEDLQVRDKEEDGPQPEGQEEEPRLNALHPGGRGERGGGGVCSVQWWACPAGLLQREPVVGLIDLEHVINARDANQQVHGHSDPSHPLTKVHHSPCSCLKHPH